MPLVTDYNEVKEIYQQTAEIGAALPLFCAEDRETLEAILAAGLKISEKLGVDMIVPNVGTEHRATADKVRYQSEQARKISAAVGKIMCIHGTSSVKPEDLPKLPDDGFVKINIYTTLAVNGGQALARQLLANLGNIFNEDQLTDLVDRGVLGKAVLGDNYAETVAPIKPKLDRVTNALRRDAWFTAVRDRCCDFFKTFNYNRFKG